MNCFSCCRRRTRVIPEAAEADVSLKPGVENTVFLENASTRVRTPNMAFLFHESDSNVWSVGRRRRLYVAELKAITWAGELPFLDEAILRFSAADDSAPGHGMANSCGV
eukprot:c13464_g1_i1.p1 GENE.c13464_g1_i1~~c13464_g1_i1.p1  ORF type:complete len:109 (-),score=4.36 c13464_g1_i1:249-575(-)